MKSLITGGAGFIGSHLSEYLLNKGEEVVVLDNLSTGRIENIKHLADNPRFRYVVGAVEDEALLAEVAHDVDVIYHLAAAVGVELIIRDPAGTIETNVGGTQAVLRYAVRYGKRVLLASTSEAYGKGTQVPFSEEDDVRYGPTSRSRWSYAISKVIDEFLLKAYVDSKGLPGVVVRLFNTVGPRQVGHYGMVIPRFVGQALQGEPITVYGDGTQQRCFAHVLDIVPALEKLVHARDAEGLVVNLGSDEIISIGELAERVRSRTGVDVKIANVPYREAYGPGFEDMEVRAPALKRAHDLIAFAPERKLDQILDDVVEWMKTSDSWKVGGH